MQSIGKFDVFSCVQEHPWFPSQLQREYKILLQCTICVDDFSFFSLGPHCYMQSPAAVTVVMRSFLYWSPFRLCDVLCAFYLSQSKLLPQGRKSHASCQVDATRSFSRGHFHLQDWYLVINVFYSFLRSSKKGTAQEKVCLAGTLKKVRMSQKNMRSLPTAFNRSMAKESRIQI